MSCKGDNFKKTLATELVNCIKTTEKPNPFIKTQDQSQILNVKTNEEIKKEIDSIKPIMTHTIDYSEMRGDNFDSHYKKDIEPILVIEETIERLTKSGYSPKKAYLVGQSLKYILRAGLKDGEDIEKDIFKAFNYLHRASRSVWVGE